MNVSQYKKIFFFLCTNNKTVIYICIYAYYIRDIFTYLENFFIRLFK